MRLLVYFMDLIVQLMGLATLGGGPESYTPALESFAAAAPFRA